MTSEQFIFIESKGSFKTTELLKINLMWCDLWELPRLLNTQFWGYYPVCNKKRSTRFRNLCPQKLGWSANSPGETKVKAECKRELSSFHLFLCPDKSVFIFACFRFSLSDLPNCLSYLFRLYVGCQVLPSPQETSASHPKQCWHPVWSAPIVFMQHTTPF